MRTLRGWRTTVDDVWALMHTRRWLWSVQRPQNHGLVYSPRAAECAQARRRGGDLQRAHRLQPRQALATAVSRRRGIRASTLVIILEARSTAAAIRLPRGSHATTLQHVLSWQPQRVARGRAVASGVAYGRVRQDRVHGQHGSPLRASATPRPARPPTNPSKSCLFVTYITEQ